MTGANVIVPAVLIGAWAPEGSPDCVAASAYAFTIAGAASAGGLSPDCRVSGVREQHASRWYVELRCGGGAPVELDVNALADERLLIARRPLGEASAFQRCDAATDQSGAR